MHPALPVCNMTASIAPNEAGAPRDALIALSEVESLTGFKKSWIYSNVAADAFPQPVKFGAATRWSRLEVVDWVKDRLASRGLGQPWKR